MKGSKEGVFSEFLLSPSLGSGSVKGGQFSVTIGGHFSMTFDNLGCRRRHESFCKIG